MVVPVRSNRTVGSVFGASGLVQCGIKRHIGQRPSSIVLVAVTLLGLFNVLVSVRYHEHVSEVQSLTLSPPRADTDTGSTPGAPVLAATAVGASASSRDDRGDDVKDRTVVRHLLPATKRSFKKFGGRVLGRVKEEDFPPPPPSPYETANPGKRLPRWAAKPFFFARRNLGTDVDVPRICYVHVGKTAGSTIGCALGFQLHCRHAMVYPPGILPGACTNLFHSNVNDCLNEDFAHYLITVRDPVERIKSWYSYETLDLLKKDCGFHTLNDLALQGLTTDDPNTSQACRDRAFRALTGKEQIGWHAYNNYEFYMKDLPQNASIGVIRSEHMLDDWNSMEEWLGSDARARPFPAKNTASKEKELNKVLTPRAQELICAALCREIGVYKHILKVAVNLSPSQVRESFTELRRSCPREADQESCPSMER